MEGLASIGELNAAVNAFNAAAVTYAAWVLRRLRKELSEEARRVADELAKHRGGPVE